MTIPRPTIALAFAVLAGEGLLSTVGAQENSRLEEQYKRVHQEAFRTVLDGDPAKALRDLAPILAAAPDDGESHYMAAVAHTALGELEAAEASARRALAHGVPAGRFAGGTLSGLEALRPRLGLENVRLVHGPVLGNVTGDSVDVWVRTAGTQHVTVSVVPEDGAAAVATATASTEAERDFTAIVRVAGLAPSTRYRYSLQVGGYPVESNLRLAFATAPAARSRSAFTLAFGGGAGYVPANERAWDAIAATSPDLLFLLGDNVYSDDPTSPAMQHYCYYRRQSRPEFARLTAATPVFAIWDDHDFGTNDCWGGPDPDQPAWKRPVFDVFRNNWPNPPYASTREDPGCYYDFYYGDVHFIMLDGRYARDPDGSGNGGTPSMLGPAQMRWLSETLARSRATFRVLCSPVPWVFEAKGDSKDTWNGFHEERAAIFSRIAELGLEGVVLMSADRHRSDLWKIDRPGTYPFYEFNSSRLTNQHVHREMPEAVFSYNDKQSFGLVTFDTTQQDPSVTYKIVSIDGDEVFTHSIRASELR